MSLYKFNSVSEGIALRLNQIAGNIAPLGLCFDPSTGNLRVSGTVAVSSLPTLGTVTTVTGVTTVSALTNQVNIGNLSASAMVVDSANTAWASGLRGRIS
jgi:hypothetical protein